MKPVSFTTLLAALIVASAASLHAQIVWSAPTNITGPADVDSLGTFVDGDSANNAHANFTVGDSTFYYKNSSPDAHIFLPNIGGTDGSPSPTPSATSADAAAYNSILTGVGYVGKSGPTANIILSSLTIGQTYQVEIWDSVNTAGRETTFTDTTYSSTPTLTDSVTLDPSSASGGIGQYAIGTFTALGTSETITFMSTTGSYNATYGEVNDVLLRAVPEPSTYALIFGGVGMLGFMLRRKKAPALL